MPHLHACPACKQLTPIRPCPCTPPRAGSTRAWRILRAQILDRDNHECTSCGAHATHAGHIVSRMNGGSDDPNNLHALCQDCNLRQGA